MDGERSFLITNFFEVNSEIGVQLCQDIRKQSQNKAAYLNPDAPNSPRHHRLTPPQKKTFVRK